jgi:hypothetical protein
MIISLNEQVELEPMVLNLYFSVEEVIARKKETEQ